MAAIRLYCSSLHWNGNNVLFLGLLHSVYIRFILLYYNKVSSDCKYLVTRIDFDIGQELFSSSGKTLLDPGFTRAMHWQEMDADEHMPDLKTNDLIPILEVYKRLNNVHHIFQVWFCKKRFNYVSVIHYHPNI